MHERSYRSRRRLLAAASVLALLAAACMCTGGLVGTAGPAPNSLDGGDGYATAGGGSIQVGGSRTAVLNSLYDAHNWTFQGHAGQTVTIQAIGHAPSVGAHLSALFDRSNWYWSGSGLPSYTAPYATTTDPRVKLIDPSNLVLGEDDDSGGGVGGWDSLLTVALPADDTYTIRVDVFSVGTYTLTLQ